MKRRTLLASALSAVAVRPGRAAAQAPFGDAHLERMKALADAVLPQTIGEAGRQRALTQFMTWVREYRADADRHRRRSSIRPNSTTSTAAPAERSRLVRSPIARRPSPTPSPPRTSATFPDGPTAATWRPT
jgi:hypothetical protein